MICNFLKIEKFSKTENNEWNCSFADFSFGRLRGGEWVEKIVCCGDETLKDEE